MGRGRRPSSCRATSARGCWRPRATTSWRLPDSARARSHRQRRNWWLRCCRSRLLHWQPGLGRVVLVARRTGDAAAADIVRAKLARPKFTSLKASSVFLIAQRPWSIRRSPKPQLEDHARGVRHRPRRVERDHEVGLRRIGPIGGVRREARGRLLRRRATRERADRQQDAKRGSESLQRASELCQAYETNASSLLHGFPPLKGHRRGLTTRNRLAATGHAEIAGRAGGLPRQTAGLNARRALLARIAARRRHRLADADLADFARVEARLDLRAGLALVRVVERVRGCSSRCRPGSPSRATPCVGAPGMAQQPKQSQPFGVSGPQYRRHVGRLRGERLRAVHAGSRGCSRSGCTRTGCPRADSWARPRAGRTCGSSSSRRCPSRCPGRSSSRTCRASCSARGCRRRSCPRCCRTGRGTALSAASILQSPSLSRQSPHW